MVADRRWSNTIDMDCYLAMDSEKKEDMQLLSVQECMEEYMFLGLRMMKGVSIQGFYHAYQKSMWEVYGTVMDRWIKEGYLQQEGDYIRFTDKGIDVSNRILADFLLS